MLARSLAGVLLAAFSLEAQSSLSGPVLGVVFESGRGLRPVRGIAGASTLGELLDLGLEIFSAAVSPTHKHALISTGDPRQLVAARLDRPEIVPIEGGVGAPDVVVFSPGGKAAALRELRSGRVQLLTGLPEAPVVAREIAAAETWGPMAVSDDGSLLVAEGGSLILYSQQEEPRPIAVLGAISGLAFRPGSLDALVADDRHVYMLRNGTEVAPVAAAVAGAVGVAFAGADRAVVAGSSGELAVLDLAAGTATSLACECAPTGLARMSNAAVFRLNEPSSKPMWLLDLSGAEPRALFVPPDAPEAPAAVPPPQ
ncbi:MAG: hypothetical protein FJW37_14390 [Acidobacteria bacterium]|nr:hypothetical protein [Acidobacteriota bacterium]